MFLDKIETDNQSIKIINEKPLWAYDLNALYVNSKFFLDKPEIVKIVITENKNKLIEIADNTYEPDIFYTISVFHDGLKIGDIYIEYSSKYIDKEINIILSQIYIVELFFIIIFSFLIFVISKTVYTPIQKIVKALQNLDKGNYEFELILDRNDEFKIIEKYFNKVIKGFNYERKKNIENMEQINKTKDELEAAYNQMISINSMLENTLKELELSETKYKNIFKYSPGGIIILNIKNENYEEINEKVLEITKNFTSNYEREKIEYIIENVEVMKLIEKMIKTKKMLKKTIKFEEIEKTLMVTVAPINNNSEYAQIFLNDITELKDLEEKLKNYAETLEVKVKMRTADLQKANELIKSQQEEMVKNAYNKAFIEVTSGIIHNIGNIVNIINMNMEELIVEYPDNEKTYKFFNEILSRELQKIDIKSKELEKIIKITPEIIETMKEYDEKIKEKIELISKKLLHLKEIIQLQQNFVGSLGTEDYNNINEIVKEVIEIYESSLEKRGINYKFNRGENQEILCDRGQIFQVISNFIKNAYEAIEEAEKKEKLLEVTTYNNKDKFIIEIKDNGIGIKEENLNKLFEFGFSTKKENGKGNGYGLYSCKSIIKKYGGEILVESKYGEYTNFKIILPKRSTK
ncbi:sensor histidine kinase [Hypnocyclicus thermotrophus]|nr:PAS domain-containing sensor histidine kinase [Hypnocyclicus thermotrophus]